MEQKPPAALPVIDAILTLLVARGVTKASFHPDGSLATVEFSPLAGIEEPESESPESDTPEEDGLSRLANRSRGRQTDAS